MVTQLWSLVTASLGKQPTTSYRVGISIWTGLPRWPADHLPPPRPLSYPVAPHLFQPRWPLPAHGPVPPWGRSGWSGGGTTTDPSAPCGLPPEHRCTRPHLWSSSRLHLGEVSPTAPTLNGASPALAGILYSPSLLTFPQNSPHPLRGRTVCLVAAPPAKTARPLQPGRSRLCLRRPERRPPHGEDSVCAC